MYPNDPFSGLPNISNVAYKYGDTGNETGRVIHQEDATGVQDFRYGNMGEIIRNRRVVVGPNIPTRVYTTEFDYDSWNRIQNIKYPDGETVTHQYDLGANLFRMYGEINSDPYDYIVRTDYDYYEQKKYMLYGNKTETFYDYSTELRRLQNLNVRTSDGLDLYANSYKYDKVGNVLDISNSATPTANAMAGIYQHQFDYDNLNRLIGAKGGFSGNKIVQAPLGNDFDSDYSLKMQYNNTHGITVKDQNHNKNGANVPANTYLNQYQYYSNTHKVSEIDDASGSGLVEGFKYDLNGNLTDKYDNRGNSRKMYWDESNRLRVVADHDFMQHYIYDASGERVLKANTDTEAVYENGTLVTNPLTLNGYTTYPSGYVVMNQLGVYTKHYYAGSQRIVSRIGDQSLEVFAPESNPELKTAASSDTKFDEKKLQRAQIADVKAFAEKAGWKKVFFKDFKPYTYEELEKMVKEDNNGDSTTQRPNPIDPPPFDGPKPIYYYHPDHLGTSTALTDFNGNAYQFFLNLPFGETMAEQLPSTYYSTPYKFNGKELDDETGLYYYGARYYDPRISIWYSVDPLAEKYSSWNPYNYTMQNPINLIDPTGMGSETTDPNKGGVRIVLDLGGGSGISGAAETRAKQIQKLNPHDKLIFITDTNLGNLKSNIETQLKQAKEDGYGKTLELSVFSHNGGDGPIGSYDEDNSRDLSRTTGSAFDRGQMSKENWADIDYNFDTNNSIAAFYGCNSASWAEQFISITNVRHASGVAGRAGPMNNFKGDADRSMFGVGDVYMRAVDEDTDQILPMFLYTRGSNREKEVYGNPTVPNKPKKKK
jgi:RHS repeat-associated protein